MAQNRFESSIAAASESALTIAQPTTASLASVYGPSVTVNWPLRCWIRVVRGSRAPVATRVPFRKLSSTNPAISAMSSGAGGLGGLLTSGVVFMKNFIAFLLSAGVPTRAVRLLGPVRHGGLEAVTTLSELRAVVLGEEVLLLEDRADLDLAALEGGLLEPLDGLVERPDLPEPVA